MKTTTVKRFCGDQKGPGPFRFLLGCIIASLKPSSSYAEGRDSRMWAGRLLPAPTSPAWPGEAVLAVVSFTGN